MLTQEQLNQLEPLTLHSKFGKLLKSAIRNWKKFKPAQNTSGIFAVDKKYKRWKGTDGCCLIGAALYGKNTENIDLATDVHKYFNLSSNECNSLISGFDGWLRSEDFNNCEARNFAVQISKIVIT